VKLVERGVGVLRIGSTKSSSGFDICRAKINTDSHNLPFEIRYEKRKITKKAVQWAGIAQSV